MMRGDGSPGEASLSDILSQDELDALLSNIAIDEEEEEKEEAPAAPAMADAGEGGDILSQDELDALLGGGLDVLAEDPPAPKPEPKPKPAPKPKASPGLSNPRADETPRNLKLLLSIPVQISVELGRTRMSVGDLLQLGQGSIIELERAASEYLDLTVNKKPIAMGEVVVVNENFGFRAVEVDSVRERLTKL